MKEVRRCQNSYCLKLIYGYQYKYGTGKYCSKDCSQEVGDLQGIRYLKPTDDKKYFYHKTFPIVLII